MNEIQFRNSVISSRFSLGFNVGQSTIHSNGERWSTAKAFLRPAMKRKNLHVMTNAFVSKVMGSF